MILAITSHYKFWRTADTHAWAFVQQPSPTPSIVYCCNDGGLFRSTDKGSTWHHRNGGGFLQTALFYNITSKPTDDIWGFEVGAFQDNGVATRHPNFGAVWEGSLGGDGGDVAYDSDYQFLYA